MPSGSSSPGVSTRSFVLVFTLAAALSAVPPAQAEFRSDLDGASSRPARVAIAWNPLADLYEGRYAFAEGTLSDSTPVETNPPPAAIQPERSAAPSSAARADKNPKKALLLSFLLPGAGEMYSGHNGRATGFFISEGVIWANYVTWQIAGHLRRDNYVEQARLNAGMGTTSESDDFWRLVGLYTRSSGSGPDSYEDALRRDARNEFPSDPAAQDAWVAERLPTGNRAWNWTSAEAQKNFRDTRHSSTRAFQHAKYSFALAILNRVASVIDTQMLHRKDQKADQSSVDGPRLRILTDMTADGGGMLLVRSTF
jgi:hypothetical protein